jgi:phosphoribosyl-ATP pyrophosphohydrolase/phosphoribosyl-AMP cyclohydrolase
MKQIVDQLEFDEKGLVPAIVQDRKSLEVLTLAYMNRTSLERTLETGETWFWSRSRGELWHKGETSGHTQSVVELRADCDSDALLVLVDPRGPACHTGAQTCFHNEIERAAVDFEENDVGRNGRLGATLANLFTVVATRRREMPEGSYTAYLFEKGLDKILKKVGEESAETIVAAKNDDASALAAEMSDLLYHLVVLMVEKGITPSQISGELTRRRVPKEAG